MLAHNTTLEQSEYRLVLVKSRSQAIWVERADGALRLPRVTIPRWTRPAEQIQRVIEAGWHLRSIVLDFLPGKMDSVHCAVVEIMSSETHDSLAAASIDKIAAEEMTSEEREAIKAILAGNGSTRGPFSRIGWIQEAMEWMRAEVGHGIAFTGDIRQFNAGGSFELARFRTQAGPAYWLKAAGEPNAHEFHVTRKLVELCSEYLPRQICAREDWNAWVMEDGGLSLRENLTLSVLEKAVVALALLQQQSISRLSELRDCGCRDQGLNSILDHLDEIMAYLEEVMTQQTSTKAPRLDQEQLHRFARFLRDAFEHMRSLEIPDALVHGDLNLGNILFDGERCVFIDWAEAYVGNPFLTFESLVAHLRSSDKQVAVWVPHLRYLYKSQWFGTLSSSRLE
jgi:aminoglycoside phosphotransferase (APT) family kinase protein